MRKVNFLLWCSKIFGRNEFLSTSVCSHSTQIVNVFRASLKRNKTKHHQNSPNNAHKHSSKGVQMTRRLWNSQHWNDTHSLKEGSKQPILGRASLRFHQTAFSTISEYLPSLFSSGYNQTIILRVSPLFSIIFIFILHLSIQKRLPYTPFTLHSSILIYLVTSPYSPPSWQDAFHS